jgi:capsular exopolysaccharide synthesis family protein
VYLGQLRDLQLDQRAQLLTQQIQRARELELGQGVLQGLWQQRAQIALSRTVPISLATFSPAKATPEPADGSGPALSRWVIILVAALLGLFLGIVLALVIERFDTKIRTPRDAEEGFGAPVLAEVPSIPRRRRGSVVVVADPLSRAADAFRLLSVSVAHSAVESPAATGNGHGPMGPKEAAGHPTPPKTILVTSAERRDGKTTVAANLAAAYAEVGKRVLVLSCDLRRPAIHKLFHVADRPGLTELLASMNGELNRPGRIDLAPYVEIMPNRVAVLPSGTPSDRPGEVLGSPRMHRFVEWTRDIVDVVVLDSAPLLAASDAASLTPEVDGVVLVARAGKTRAEPAGRSTDLLERLGATVIGVVLNDTKDRSSQRRRRSYRPTRRMRTAPGSSTSRDGDAGAAEPGDPAPKHAGIAGRAARRTRG